VTDKKTQTSAPPVPAAEEAQSDQSLGQFMIEARERKGMSRDDVVRDSHLPLHYLKMIESDNYGEIADQLYVLPFLRRYATFLGLDAEEVASRFVRDVQRSETNVVRMSDPITMVAKKRGAWRAIAIAFLVIAIVVLLADLAYRRYAEFRQALAPSPVESPIPMSNSTIITSVAPASPEAEPSTQNAVQPLSVPSLAAHLPPDGKMPAAASSHAITAVPRAAQSRIPESDVQ
jgi:cytoskeleton protein RodZ